MTMHLWPIFWPFVAVPLFAFLIRGIRAVLKEWQVQETNAKRYGVE